MLRRGRQPQLRDAGPLSRMQCMHAGIGTLAPTLGHLTCLEHLDLRKQCMGCVGVGALAPHLHRLPQLTCLELDGNALAATAAAVLAAAVAGGALSALQVLGSLDSLSTPSRLL